MAISLAAKLGIFGILTVGGAAGTYYAWDHITLYEVEREVLEKNVQFEKEVGTDQNEINIKVKESADSGFVSLPNGYSWSCKIKLEAKEGELKGDNTSKVTSFWDKLKKKLPTSDASETSTEEKESNKKLLVRLCALFRNSKEKQSHQKVVGLLELEEEDLEDILKDSTESTS